MDKEIQFNFIEDGVGVITIPEPTCVIHIGKDPGLDIRVNKHFNRFQKKMMKWCFGLEVEDINDD